MMMGKIILDASNSSIILFPERLNKRLFLQIVYPFPSSKECNKCILVNHLQL